MTKDGRMISIEVVESGLACECICPECEGPLVAAKGEIYRHHFRHLAERAACWQAGESALHRYAKQLVCETLDLGYPRQYRGFQGEMFLVGLGSLRSAAAEVDLYDGVIRTDVLADFDEPVAVEFFVAHRVPTEKVQRFAQYGIAAMEVDLSLYHRVQNKSEAEWREIILHRAPRYWLYPPRAAREAEDAKRQQWLEQRREMEAAMRVAHLQFEEERLRQERIFREMEERDGRRREQQKILAEAQERERKAADKALKEYELIERAKERFKYASQTAALAQQREREQEPPNLQSLVAAHGSYPEISAEAWDDHQRRVARWRDETLGLAPVFKGDPANFYRFSPTYRRDDEPCIVCDERAGFGYREEGKMKWFCGNHRLAQYWADARQ
jgi:hypothetical protein